MKINLKPVAAVMALTLAATPVWAIQTFYMVAKTYDKTLPDGSTVPMWGYAIDADNDANGVGDCWETPNASRMACINDPALVPTLPGPQLEVSIGENDIRFRLSNGLPEPTSIIIPGQRMPSNIQGPTWNDGTTGARTNPTQRVRSFGVEAAANGGRRSYVWRASQGAPITDNGTLIYHSGTHPQKQVYMGLAGTIKKDAAAGEVYAGVGYVNDVTLFYSDLDPLFNAQVVAGTLSSAMQRHPSWFLVNGEPYEEGVTQAIAAGNLGENTLLRLASAASDAHVVVLQGMDMTIHGEDGIQYTWQEQGVGGLETPAPRKQYSTMLPPAKTKDAIIVAPANGNFAIYDGDGYMTNPSDPANEAVADTRGGMLRFLAFGGTPPPVNLVPTANPDSFETILSAGNINGNILSNDTGGDLPVTVTDVTPVSAALTWSADGSFTYLPSVVGQEVFNYTVTDNNGDTSNSTLTFTTIADIPASVLPDAINTIAGSTEISGNVLANDGGNAPLSITAASLTLGVASDVGVGTLTLNSDGGFSFVPLVSGNATVNYTMADANGDTLSSTLELAVVADLLPVANPDTASAIRNGADVFDSVLTNDVPGNGVTTVTSANQLGNTSPLNVGAPFNTAAGNVLTLNADGSYTFTPLQTGVETFDYTVSDENGDTSSSTLEVTVTAPQGTGAILYLSTAGAGTIPGVPGPYDDADVYNVDAGGVFGRVYDAVTDLGLPNTADIDAMSINGGIIYLSFGAASTSVGGMNVPDEDVVAYDTASSTWSTFFDGSLCGLDQTSGQDIDAVSVVGNTLYFSIVGSGGKNPVGGVAGSSDDADIYSWSGGTDPANENCSKVIDAVGSPMGLPAKADVDALTVKGTTYLVSFRTDVSVPGLGTVSDESVLSYSNGVWSVFFSGAGQLDGSSSQNVDAIHAP